MLPADPHEIQISWNVPSPLSMIGIYFHASRRDHDGFRNLKKSITLIHRWRLKTRQNVGLTDFNFIHTEKTKRILCVFRNVHRENHQKPAKKRGA